MEYYKINPQKPDYKIVKRAIQVLKGGGIIVYPTNTLYGLGVDAFNKRALDRLFVIKQRGPHQAVSLLVASLEQLRSLFGVLPSTQYKHLLRLLPGKFTFLVQSRLRENLLYLATKTDAQNKTSRKLGSFSQREKSSNSKKPSKNETSTIPNEYLRV